ncbi:DUF1127 domain-containing protein [Bradyrhizobium sp. UFLA05-109]
MSALMRETMTNHHGWDLVKQVSDTLHTWRDRVRQRRELARWTDRDLHDVGLSWSDIAGLNSNRVGAASGEECPAPVNLM